MNPDSSHSPWPKSQQEHDRGIHAEPGDVVWISIYFDNGAPDHDIFTIYNAHASVQYDNSTATKQHTIRAILSADNAEQVDSSLLGGDITIFTSVPTYLKYLEGSTSTCRSYDATKEQGLLPRSRDCGIHLHDRKVSLPDGIANGFVTLGTIRPGFNYDGTVDSSYEIIGAKKESLTNSSPPVVNGDCPTNGSALYVSLAAPSMAGNRKNVRYGDVLTIHPSYGALLGNCKPTVQVTINQQYGPAYDSQTFTMDDDSWRSVLITGPFFLTQNHATKQNYAVVVRYLPPGSQQAFASQTENFTVRYPNGNTTQYRNKVSRFYKSR